MLKKVRRRELNAKLVAAENIASVRTPACGEFPPRDWTIQGSHAGAEGYPR